MIKIHLIKSGEVSAELFTRVVSLLTAIPGQLVFYGDPEAIKEFNEEEIFIKTIPDRPYFEKIETFREIRQAQYSRTFPLERPTADWYTFFRACNQYREERSLESNEFVFLLTDVANRQNWFSALDPAQPHNGFIHVSDWDHFINCDPAFPVAFEAVALILRRHMFSGMDDVMASVHRQPIGCINDFCEQKRDVVLKLRTADVCGECAKKLQGKLPPPVIHHALSLLESCRVKMLFSQSFRQQSPLSRLVITTNKKVILPDFGNIEICLRPLEKSIYFLFLHHPDGVYQVSLCDHREEIYEIYGSISGRGSVQEIRRSVEDLVNVTQNSFSEKVSRIKRSFEAAIGKELAKEYYISGERLERKRIKLDRTLLIWQ
jgi:hypothetical protein